MSLPCAPPPREGGIGRRIESSPKVRQGNRPSYFFSGRTPPPVVFLAFLLESVVYIRRSRSVENRFRCTSNHINKLCLVICGLR